MADTFSKLMDKLSSYQLFNYMFPGIIFNYGFDQITTYSLTPDDIIYRLFVYYVTGMVLSRIGSTVIEPICKKICIVVYARYKDFLDAAENDQKLNTLVMENNTFRSLTATFICLLIFYLIDRIEWLHDKYDSTGAIIICLVLLICVFILSFRKQTSFIRSKTHRDIGKKDADELPTLKEEQKKINLWNQII